MDHRITEIVRLIRDVPDFPKPGILFKDITPLLGDASAFRSVTDLLAETVAGAPVDLVVGIESRGFIFGSALAQRLGVGFAPVRKPNKLPYRRHRVTYETEYSTDSLEMHEDAIPAGAQVLVVDDLLATGGTAQATARLVEGQKGKVATFVFVVELDFLAGRKRLDGYPVRSLVHF